MICNLLATTAREFGTYYRIAHSSGFKLARALTTAIVSNRFLFGFESHSCETEMLILLDKVYLPIPPENIYVRRLTLLP